jgi:hypothetical protein
MADYMGESVELNRDKHGRLLVRRWRRFGVDRDRHHLHDFTTIVIDGECHEICSCGQTRRRL